MSDPLGELHRILPQDIEALLAHVLKDLVEELVLLGPLARLAPSPSDWPDAPHGKRVHQLSVLVDDLPAQLQSLERLRSLNLSGNQVGEAGAPAIAKGLPQLITLDLRGTAITDLSPFGPFSAAGTSVSSEPELAFLTA